MHLRIILVPEPSYRSITPVCCRLALLDPAHGVFGADGAVDGVEAEGDAGDGEQNKEMKLLSNHVCEGNIE